MNPTFARRSASAALALGLLGAVPAASAAAHAPREKLPTTSQFAAGTCRTVAGPVLAVATLSARYRGADALPARDRKELLAQQDLLAETNKAAEPALRAPLTDLVTAIGFVRLRAASRTYEPAVLDAMDDARKDLQRACVR